MSRESAHRVAIANANVPNMLGQISTTMAGAGLNIHNMVNKSRGEMAYTLVDVDSPVDAATLARLAAIGGVLSVRYLPLRAGPERLPGCAGSPRTPRSVGAEVPQFLAGNFPHRTIAEGRKAGDSHHLAVRRLPPAS